jgi:hypothetical protein
LENPAGERAQGGNNLDFNCKCKLLECGQVLLVAVVIHGRVQEFGSEILSGGKLYLEFDYFKKNSVLIFKILGTCQNCHKMRFDGKKF